METAKKDANRTRRGLVLPLALTIALILAILGVGLLQLGLGGRVIAGLNNAEISARTAGDAGITHALHAMNAAVNFDGTIDPALWPANVVYPPGISLPNSSTNFSYNLIDHGTYWEVVSTGRVNRPDRRPKTIHAITRRQSVWFGVGVQDTFVVHNDATFGTYPPGSTFDGSVRTNSVANDAITLHAGVNIPGDVAVGPGGDEGYVVKMPSGTATVDGDIYATEESLAFPDVELPDNVVWQNGPALTFVNVSLDEFGNPILDEFGNPVTISRATITGVAGTGYVYDDLLIPMVDGTAWTEVHVIGDVTINVLHDVRLGNGCKLIIGDREPTVWDRLRLYLGRSAAGNPADISSMVAENGSAMITLPRSADAADLPHSLDFRIYGLPTCTTTGTNPAITIHNSGEFWGVIYAPEARLDIRNSGTMYGGFVGYSIDLYNSGALYYDSRIPLEQVEGPWFFEIERWWEETGTLAGTPAP